MNGTTTVVDGTLLPCWSWKDKHGLYSGKHDTTGHNVQVVSDLSGRRVALSDLFPGIMHDKKAWKESPRRESPETQHLHHHPPPHHRTRHRDYHNLANIPHRPTRFHHHQKNHILHTKLLPFCISLNAHL
ncbi:transposase family protein [Rathayibacter toxicus]|uniref:transposase family protein n=1 Tax=Rathayibacter toxicus TaxID=145458 RepID=UPI00358F6C6D